MRGYMTRYDIIPARWSRKCASVSIEGAAGAGATYKGRPKLHRATVAAAPSFHGYSLQQRNSRSRNYHTTTSSRMSKGAGRYEIVERDEAGNITAEYVTSGRSSSSSSRIDVIVRNVPYICTIFKLAPTTKRALR